MDNANWIIDFYQFREFLKKLNRKQLVSVAIEVRDKIELELKSGSLSMDQDPLSWENMSWKDFHSTGSDHDKEL